MRAIAIMLLLAVGSAGCGAAGAPAAGPQPATTAVTVSGAGTLGTESGVLLTTRSGVVPHTSQVQAPPDSAFAMLAAVYPALGIEVAQVDRKTRSLGNVSFRRTNRLGRMPLSEIVRCGTTGLGTSTAETYRVALSVVSTVHTRQGATILESRVDGAATPNGLSSSVQCTSTGALERAIARAVQLKAAGVK
jgi:hypothetical protein